MLVWHSEGDGPRLESLLIRVEEILEETVYPTVDEFPATEGRAGLEKSPDTSAAGPGSAVGSHRLVSLVVLIDRGDHHVEDKEARRIPQ
jgi:hypothetical protein